MMFVYSFGKKYEIIEWFIKYYVIQYLFYIRKFIFMLRNYRNNDIYRSSSIKQAIVKNFNI